MGYVGWATVSNQANTSTGGATRTVADVSAAVDVGRSVGGEGVINTYSGAPSPDPGGDGFILLEGAVQEHILLETGSPPNRIQME